VEERFPGELETLRADNMRLRRLLKLSEEQARAADPDQATLTGAPESPVNMRSAPEDKVRFFFDLFRCRSDVYALRWENRRDGRSGWMPAIRGYWRKGMNRADAPYLPLTPDVIGQHLRGDVHIGLYPLGDDDTCWWVTADFDKQAAMLDALASANTAQHYSSTPPRWNPSTTNGPTCRVSRGCRIRKWRHSLAVCPIRSSATVCADCSYPPRRKSCRGPQRSSGRLSHPDLP